MTQRIQLLVLLAVAFAPRVGVAEVSDERLAAAGENRPEIEQALARVPESERAGLEFLVRNMPPHDLAALSADYLLENTRLAYQAWRDDPWAREVPEPVFFNAVLPYASINERRDDWRADFRRRFRPLVAEAQSPGEAAAILNQKIFAEVGVKYSTQRNKADQSPYESIESGLASCTGLSILLIDACRAVGVPARLVGTPLWSNKSGNHSWVEVWDDGWHFTGAAEPTGNELDRGWFVAAAAKADREHPLHAIYATSFQQTPLSFPCVWDPTINYISAVNVTDRYTRHARDLPDGHVDALFRVCSPSGDRIAADLTILRGEERLFTGRSNDERFDANDHRRVALPKDEPLVVRATFGELETQRVITPTADDEVITITLDKAPAAEPAAKPAAKESAPAKPEPNEPAANESAANESAANGTAANGTVAGTRVAVPLRRLAEFLDTEPGQRQPLDQQDFAQTPLTAADVRQARARLAADRLERIRRERRDEFESRVLTLGDHRMPFALRRFGEKPADGWSLYISLHGGGGAPAAVNDQQWKNQQRLYELDEGIYVAPRAPTNTWDLWHQHHIDRLFRRLIDDLVAFEDVNRDRVYILGYSAGGDGVYQLAPRMADRWAAAAMMAGHPNETSPLGLRNLPFALQVGGRDTAYNRNEVARQWQQRLAELRKDDPGGYEHFVKIYPDKGHWMDREDAVAIPWMARHTRNPTPRKIVWRQDNVTHSQFYWLGVDKPNERAGSEVIAEVAGQNISIAATDIDRLTVFLDDRFIDLDRPVTITGGGRELFAGQVPRTLATLARTLDEHEDPQLAFPAAITIDVPPPFPDALVPRDDIPRYTAAYTAPPLKIDGKLDEAAWKAAQKTASFVDLISGEPTQHETRAAILWDDTFLYIGFWVSEPNVDAKYKNRDDPIYYDNDVEVFIAGQDAYYEFEVNAFGTIYEAMFIWEDAYDAGKYATDPQLKRDVPKSQPFNGVGLKDHPRGPRIAFLGYDLPDLQSAVHIQGTLNDDSDVDQGWTVELAFPWKSLQPLARGDGRALPPNPGDQWGIDLFRFNKYKAPAPANDSGGWALGKHGVWDSHIPEIFPIVTFAKP